jgi:hypothetical protein
MLLHLKLQEEAVADLQASDSLQLLYQVHNSGTKWNVPECQTARDRCTTEEDVCKQAGRQAGKQAIRQWGSDTHWYVLCMIGERISSKLAERDLCSSVVIMSPASPPPRRPPQPPRLGRASVTPVVCCIITTQPTSLALKLRHRGLSHSAKESWSLTILTLDASLHSHNRIWISLTHLKT